MKSIEGKKAPLDKTETPKGKQSIADGLEEEENSPSQDRRERGTDEMGLRKTSAGGSTKKSKWPPARQARNG